MRKRTALPQADGHLDLVPLIDCVFLILLFFMLAGRLSDQNRDEQLTVPPGRTARAITDQGGWTREVIRVDGGLHLGARHFRADPEGFTALRALLDRIHDHAAKDVDAHGLAVARVVVEIRADGDARTGTVQELQQILGDAIDPASGQPRPAGAARRPFTHLDFTARDAG